MMGAWKYLEKRRRVGLKVKVETKRGTKMKMKSAFWRLCVALGGTNWNWELQLAKLCNGTLGEREPEAQFPRLRSGSPLLRAGRRAARRRSSPFLRPISELSSHQQSSAANQTAANWTLATRSGPKLVPSQRKVHLHFHICHCLPFGPVEPVGRGQSTEESLR